MAMHKRSAARDAIREEEGILSTGNTEEFGRFPYPSAGYADDIYSKWLSHHVPPPIEEEFGPVRGLGFRVRFTHKRPSLDPANPPNMEDIFDEIEESKSILKLQDDWDERGSPRYAAETWRRATSFVREGAKYMWKDYRKQLPVPDLIPASDGCIDIEWSIGSRELVVRVPPSDGGRANAHIYERDCLSLEGYIDMSCPDSCRLLAWIAR